MLYQSVIQKQALFTVFFLWMMFLLSCSAPTKPGIRVVFHIKWANNKKFFLELLPYNGGKPVIIDSALAKGDIDSITFNIPGRDERICRIYAQETDLTIMFITDNSTIDVYGNYGNSEQFSFRGSRASTSVHAFLERQDSIASVAARLSKLADSLKSAGAPADAVRRAFNEKLNFLFLQYRNFGDSISSPGAFMAIYNNIDFGNDYKGLRRFIDMAAKRFSSFQPIQQLKAEALSMIKIYEEEYQVGDTLPSITLPDINGLNFSTSALKGKYYLIDFWSSWCAQCMDYTAPKKRLLQQFSDSSFQIVSVAIDSEKEDWKSLVERNQMNWTQLIDEQMWSGPAVKTLKFDSIPFNFLVSPNGIVIAKAIKADSLVNVVSRVLKK